MLKASTTANGCLIDCQCFSDIHPDPNHTLCCFVFVGAVQTAGSVGKIQLSIPKQAKGKWASVGQPLEFHNSFLRQKDRGETKKCSTSCMCVMLNYSHTLCMLQMFLLFTFACLFIYLDPVSR